MQIATQPLPSTPLHPPGLSRDYVITESALYNAATPVSGWSVYIAETRHLDGYEKLDLELKAHLHKCKVCGSEKCPESKTHPGLCPEACRLTTEMANLFVTLYHPWTLTRCRVLVSEFERCRGITYWPPEQYNAPHGEFVNLERLIKRILDNLQDFAYREKQHAAAAWREVVATLQGVPVEDIPSFKPARAYDQQIEAEVDAEGVPVLVQKTGRRPGVIEAIKEAIRQPRTEEEIAQFLAERFPERNLDSMRTTIKCQVKRDLPKRGLVIVRKEGSNGTLFHWTNPCQK